MQLTSSSTSLRAGGSDTGPAAGTSVLNAKRP